MTRQPTNLPFSRGAWTLARYLDERSPAPLPPVVHASDDVLHVAKLAVAAAVPCAVYVVDEQNRYLGTITDNHLAREVFERLVPDLYLDAHPRGVVATLSRMNEDAADLTAVTLMRTAPSPVPDSTTVKDTIRLLYKQGADELPVINSDGELVGVIRSLDILREWTEDTLLVHLGDETESFY